MTRLTNSFLRIAPGLLVFMLALTLPGLRRPDGHLLAEAWTLAVGGIALILFGVGLRSRWQRILGLLALALFGQASALAMLNVPNYEVIQHYRSWQELASSTKGFWLLAPMAQTIVMVFGLYRYRATVITWLRQVITLPVTILLFGTTVAIAAYPNWSISLYLGELLLAVWVILVNLFNLIFIAAAVPDESLARFAKSIRNRAGQDKLLPWIAAAWVTGVSGALCWLVFDRVPHVPDEVGYLFQAKHFSLGKLYLPAPPDAAAFDLGNLHTDGIKWWNYGFPAWPAVLAIGVRLGAGWLVNPLLGGLTILLSWSLLARIYRRSQAQAMIALLAVSPWFLVMSASFMPHPLALVWVLVGLLGLQKAKETGRGLWGMMAGASLGCLLLTRPLEAVAIAFAVGIWTLLTLGTWRLIIRTSAWTTLAGVCVGSLIFPYNHALTGDFLLTPHQKYADARYAYPGADRLGFGPDVGNVGWTHLDPIPGHGLVDIIINASQNAYYVGFELFGWGFGSTLFVTLFVLWRRWKREDMIFLLIPSAIIAAHSFYWFSGGQDYGARYWYQILIPMVVLSTRGIQELQQRLTGSHRHSPAVARIKTFVVIASLVALVNFTPWRSLGKYYRYRGVSADVARLAEKCQLGHSLVFIEDRDDYASAFIFNPPALDWKGPIYVRYPGIDGVPAVAQKFPDRCVWIVSGSLSRPESVKVRPYPADTNSSCPQPKLGCQGTHHGVS